MAKDRTEVKTPEPDKTPEPEKPEDLLMLDRHTGFMQNGTLRSWEGGTPITNPSDIADLAKMPGKRYRLLK